MCVFLCLCLSLISYFPLFCFSFLCLGVPRPPQTPFEDGVFRLSMEFTEEYPQKAPVVKFLTKIFHPNVYPDGSICLDILQNRWSSTYHVLSVLTSIQSLLGDPNADSPANNNAAEYALSYTHARIHFCADVHRHKLNKSFSWCFCFRLCVNNTDEYERHVRATVEESWEDKSELAKEEED
eukprot:m.46520 g.46520  ORF g.46520 m.46520 type:complete len:181 (-) comp10722_c2_seq4:293-835(-)